MKYVILYWFAGELVPLEPKHAYHNLFSRRKEALAYIETELLRGLEGYPDLQEGARVSYVVCPVKVSRKPPAAYRRRYPQTVK